MKHARTPKLAPFAVTPETGGQRRHRESRQSAFDPFDLDRHRIIQSTAFRRLMRKTQVVAPSTGDHFRTRLTHTLEVAHVSRLMAVGLRANEILAEAIALAHDLGHAPFGHAGEKALDELMTEYGGFNHNTHALRVVDFLEHPNPEFRGLNLTDATRNGLLEHQTRFDEPGAHEGHSVEGEIASIADRIAYDTHDLEDAIGAHYVELSDLEQLQLWSAARRDTRTTQRHQKLNVFSIRRVVIDGIMNTLTEEAIRHTAVLLKNVDNPRALANIGKPLVTLPAPTEKALTELETFLLEKMYRRDEVVAADLKGRQQITELFSHYHEAPHHLPDRFRERVESQGLERVICDYIAGMTDRFCDEQHAMCVRPESPTAPGRREKNTTK